MLQKDVHVGLRCGTKVSGEVIAVEVISVVEKATSFGGLGGQTKYVKRFICKRLDSRGILPKARSAAALRAL